VTRDQILKIIDAVIVFTKTEDVDEMESMLCGSPHCTIESQYLHVLSSLR